MLLSLFTHNLSLYAKRTCCNSSRVTLHKIASGKHVFRVQSLCNCHLSHFVTGAFGKSNQVTIIKTLFQEYVNRQEAFSQTKKRNTNYEAKP